MVMQITSATGSIQIHLHKVSQNESKFQKITVVWFLFQDKQIFLKLLIIYVNEDILFIFLNFFLAVNNEKVPLVFEVWVLIIPVTFLTFFKYFLQIPQTSKKNSKYSFRQKKNRRRQKKDENISHWKKKSKALGNTFHSKVIKI